MKQNARALAAQVVAEVMGEKRSLSAVLPVYLDRAQARDRGLVQELSYGVLRWYPRLESWLQPWLRKPLKAREHQVRALLLVGIYQLAYLSLAPHGIVHDTVEATRQLKKEWAGKLVNAVLRAFQRQQPALLAAPADEDSQYCHPQWLLHAIRRDWPDHWQAIVAANNQRPPMSLRVNTRRHSREAYLEILHQAGLAARPIMETESGVELNTPLGVEQIPGFAQGDVSVQDGAAQLAVQLLDAQGGMRVLDACAAPGGKTGHIRERSPQIAGLLALDQDAGRLQRVEENLQRLQLTAEIRAGDAAEVEAWWDGQAFDRILLDAPCSATGVIRRHPDIKWLRTEQDIAGLVQQQRALLQALWPLLAPGGLLLYCTCSVLRAENVDQMSVFLQQHTDAREVPIDATWGHACVTGRQLLPGEGGMDGFYFAGIRKQE